MLIWLFLATVWADSNPTILECSNSRLKLEMNSIGESGVVFTAARNRCPYRIGHRRNLTIAGSKAVILVLSYAGECKAKVVGPRLLKGLELELAELTEQSSAEAFIFSDSAPETFKKCKVRVGLMKDLLRRVAASHHP